MNTTDTLKPETFNPLLANIAQAKLCKELGYPDFTPLNGKCFNCRNNIYTQVTHSVGNRTWVTGISVEKASAQHITGCPHCNCTYCD